MYRKYRLYFNFTRQTSSWFVTYCFGGCVPANLYAIYG